MTRTWSERAQAGNDNAVAEDDLQAYVDGQLDSHRRAGIESYLAANPRDAERLAAYRAHLDNAWKDPAPQPAPGGPVSVVVVGSLIIVASGTIGMAWQHLRGSGQWTVREVHLAGVVVHLAMLVSIFAFPGHVSRADLFGLALPVLVVFPAATAAVGALLLRRRELDPLQRLGSWPGARRDPPRPSTRRRLQLRRAWPRARATHPAMAALADAGLAALRRQLPSRPANRCPDRGKRIPHGPAGDRLRPRPEADGVHVRGSGTARVSRSQDSFPRVTRRRSALPRRAGGSAVVVQDC